VARQEEPLGIHYQSLVDPPENRVFFYRVYAFSVDGVVVGESPDVHSLMRRVGDIVVVGIHYFCDEEVAARFRWEELIADDPHPETLWRRLPESCDEWTNTIAHVMRKHDMGWWVVNVTWMRMGAGSVPTWGPAYNFYLSKRK
jgi:hypothetical protein